MLPGRVLFRREIFESSCGHHGVRWSAQVFLQLPKVKWLDESDLVRTPMEAVRNCSFSQRLLQDFVQQGLSHSRTELQAQHKNAMPMKRCPSDGSTSGARHFSLPLLKGS